MWQSAPDFSLLTLLLLQMRCCTLAGRALHSGCRQCQAGDGAPQGRCGSCGSSGSAKHWLAGGQLDCSAGQCLQFFSLACFLFPHAMHCQLVAFALHAVSAAHPLPLASSLCHTVSAAPVITASNKVASQALASQANHNANKSKAV